MTDQRPGATDDPGAALLELYEQALPQVFGYLVSRGGSVSMAEELAAETFLAAVTAVRDRTLERPTSAWLLTVARHKLIDHWRRQGRERRSLRLLSADPECADDPWDERLDALRARQVLAGLGPHHRAALTLRYLDGLSVPDVANVLHRSVHATEALLVRARNAFRAAYREGGDHG